MLSIVITAFKEPETIGRAIAAFLKQDYLKKNNYELIVATPDKETQDIVKTYMKKNKKVRIFQDPGKGKSYALNLLLPELKGDVIIFSDGDVFVGKDAVGHIMKYFRHKNTGCVTARVVSVDSGKTMFGYWSHLMCWAAHRLRARRMRKGKFLECSGYLWAFRNKVIKKFPLDVGEDTIVPIMFYLKQWGIKYAEKALVFVSYPKNLKDFLKQKTRTAGAHDNIHKYVSKRKIPRMKTFWNEVFGGLSLFMYPRNLKELAWTIWIFPFRLYIWLTLFFNSYFRGRKYSDNWKRVETTK